MLHRLVLILLLVPTPVLAAGLGADEAALSERLRQGLRPTGEAGTPRLSAALGALAVAEGRRDEAARHFEAVEGFDSDCALRARLAELERGEACPRVRPQRLDAALLEPPAAFLIVSARPEESGSGFPAAVLATALRALAPAGGLSIESTGDRFRVTGSAALEGLWYLEDRLLLAARPAPGRGGAEAGLALDAFLALRSPELAREPAQPDAIPERSPVQATTVVAHGLALDLPAGWSSASRGGAWLAPAADSGDAFPPRVGAVLVKPQREGERTERRRNVLARRKRTGEKQSPTVTALPAGATLVDSRVLAGLDSTTALEWRPAGGGGVRQTLMCSASVSGRSLLVIAHLGEQLDTESALHLLEGIRPATP